MKIFKATRRGSGSARGHSYLSSRTMKIVQTALQTPEQNGYFDFNTSSESEKVIENSPDLEMNIGNLKFKNINKKVENWLKKAEEDGGPFFESVNDINCCKSFDKSLMPVQSVNTDLLNIDNQPHTSIISEDGNLMILKQLYPVNANDIPIKFNPNNKNFKEDTYLLPLPPLQANCISIGYESNHLGGEDRDLLILEPLKAVNLDQIQTDFQPNKDNINVGENLTVLKSLQTMDADSIQKDFESNNSDYDDRNDDDFNDRNWEPLQPSSESDGDTIEEDILPEKDLLEEENNIVEPNSYPCKKAYKKTYCTFCESYVISKHFSRHLQQRHKEKNIVKLLLDAKSSKEKRSIIMTIRNKGNLKLNKRNGTIIPKKCMKVFSEKINDSNYIICAKCKGYFRSTYIVRHTQNCFANETNRKHDAHPKVESFILSLQADYQNYMKSDPLRKELIKKLRFDDIGKAVISDPIILEYGMRLLQTAKNIKKRTTVARNKMRECARLLIQAKRQIPTTNSIVTILDILKPEYIDYLVAAVKIASKFSENGRTYGAASYALHQGKTLKDLIDIATYLISKKDQIISKESLENSSSILDQLKILRDIIENNWAREIGSLALKDLTIKKSRNHSKKLLPLTEDVMKLREHCLKKAENAVTILRAETNRMQYFILVEVTFILILLHNRKRVGDIQFIELADVTQPDTIEQKDEILESLTQTERILTKFYKKIHTIGKGSKELLVLIPRDVQQFVDTLVAERIKYVDLSNKYFFTNPKSADEWINGCYIQSKYSKECGAKQPTLMRSTRLRKHIATMMQLMDLRKNEIGQLASFMGHTEKTHREFYRLPKDVMMIAKVSKILLKLEKGELIDCKNKRLDEIDVHLDEPVLSNSSSSEAEDEVSKISSNFKIAISSSGTSKDKKNSEEDVSLTSDHEENLDAKSKSIENRPITDSEDEENMNDGDVTSAKVLKKLRPSIKKKTWSSDDINLIKRHFSKYLVNNSSYPSGVEIKKFSEKYLKSDRTVVQIKSKIQHLKKTV